MVSGADALDAFKSTVVSGLGPHNSTTTRMDNNDDPQPCRQHVCLQRCLCNCRRAISQIIKPHHRPTTQPREITKLNTKVQHTNSKWGTYCRSLPRAVSNGGGRRVGGCCATCRFRMFGQTNQAHTLTQINSGTKIGIYESNP